MKFQKSRKMTNYYRYSRLQGKVIHLYDTLETLPEQNVKLLSFYSYIKDAGIIFPNEQTEEDFIKTIGCRRNTKAEGMLVKYVQALEEEKEKRLPHKRHD